MRHLQSEYIPNTT